MSVNVELEESIEKWEDIVKGNDEDKGQMNCSLCQKYLTSRGCMGCIVQQETGQSCCYDTPFRTWFKHHRDEHVCAPKQAYTKGRRIECPECLMLAQKELDYLKSLRA